MTKLLFILDEKFEEVVELLEDRGFLARNVLCDDTRRFIDEIIFSFGVPRAGLGFRCLVEAVDVALTSDGRVTKSIYPEVAKRLGQKAPNVERNIRSSIAKAWESRSAGGFERVFGAARPTNAEFIARAVEVVRERLGAIENFQ